MLVRGVISARSGAGLYVSPGNLRCNSSCRPGEGWLYFEPKVPAALWLPSSYLESLLSVHPVALLVLLPRFDEIVTSRGVFSATSAFKNCVLAPTVVKR